MRKLLTILFLFFSFCGYSQLAILGSGKSSEPDTVPDFSMTVICASQSAELSEGLVSYYGFEDTDGIGAADSRGANHLLIYGSVTQESSGIVGNYSFDFTTDAYVGWQEILRFTGDFSLKVEVNTTASAGFDGILSNYRWNGSIAQGWDLGLYNDVADFSIRNAAGAGNVTSTTIINDGVDHQIVVTYDATSGLMSMYVDGNLEDTDTHTAPTYTSYHYLTIGRREVTNYFEGLIDDPAFWNRELPQSDVTTLLTAGAYPWGFDCIPDSVRMQVPVFGSSGDYFVLNYKVGSYPTGSNDGKKLLTFYAKDTTAFKDTTILWDGELSTDLYFALWSFADGARTPVPNRDTTFSDTPPQIYPDTAVVFNATKQAPDSVLIEVGSADQTGTLFTINYIEGLLPPASSDAPFFLLEVTDPGVLGDTVLFIPVPDDGTVYTFALWSYKDDHTTPVPNIDSAMLDSVGYIDTAAVYIASYVSGVADSLRHQIQVFPSGADTFRVQGDYDKYPTAQDEGINIHAFGLDDTASYNDTTTEWLGLVDTTLYDVMFSGKKGLTWGDTANQDTAYIGSGTPYTPPDEASVYDTAVWQDFEHRTSGEYTSTQFIEDWGNIYRRGDDRWPYWESGLGYRHIDSIVTDEATGSQALYLWSPGDCVNCPGDYDCVTCGDRCPWDQGGRCAMGDRRSGDTWRYPFTDQQEIYLSYNVKFREGFIPVEGGKLFGLRGGGPDPVGFEPPDDSEGFSVGTMWRNYGGIGFYNFFHNQTSSQYAQTILWDDFQPTGTGLEYDAQGRFIFDFDSEQWYNITYRMVNNTFTGGVPNYDGFMEGYINGRLIEQFNGMYLTSAANEGEGIDALIVSMFFGGSSNYHASQRDEWIIFDDIALWTYDVSVTDVPRGNELSSSVRIINPPGMSEKISAVTTETVEKQRVYVLTDIGNEPDDQMSLVRFLSYADEYDIEGLSAVTGVWKQSSTDGYRITNVLTEYGDVRTNMLSHTSDLPTEAFLKGLVNEGPDLYGMNGVGSGHNSAASISLTAAIDVADDRPLWVCAWGGINVLAQAIWNVQDTRTAAQLETFINKIRVYAIADQDNSGWWLRDGYPDLFYVVSPSTLGSSQYDYATWVGISGDLFPAFNIGPSLRVDLVENTWLQTNIDTDHGDLGDMYLEHTVIMEGDTPSFLWLINNGLGSMNLPSYGGWGGRYKLATPTVASRTETRPIWYNSNDSVYADDPIGEAGWEFEDDATVWRWREDFQLDFAARMDWQKSGVYGNSNHNPEIILSVSVNGDSVNNDATRDIIRVECYERDRVEMSATGTTDPDSDGLSYLWWVYDEAGSEVEATIANPATANATFIAPSLVSRKEFHVILEAIDDGTPVLKSYRRIIISVKND